MYPQIDLKSSNNGNEISWREKEQILQSFLEKIIFRTTNFVYLRNLIKIESFETQI